MCVQQAKDLQTVTVNIQLCAMYTQSLHALLRVFTKLPYVFEPVESFSVDYFRKQRMQLN